MEISQIAPIIIAIIAAIPGVLALVSESRKTRIDAAKVAQDAAIEIINPLREELKTLRTRVGELESLVKAKDERISDLERNLAQRNIDVSDRERRIDDLETEVADLRLRLEAVEKSNGNGGSK